MPTLSNLTYDFANVQEVAGNDSENAPKNLIPCQGTVPQEYYFFPFK